MDELKKQIKELQLFVQSLEQRVFELETGSFGTGVYLDGCNDADKEFIKPIVREDKKEGE